MSRSAKMCLLVSVLAVSRAQAEPTLSRALDESAASHQGTARQPAEEPGALVVADDPTPCPDQQDPAAAVVVEGEAVLPASKRVEPGVAQLAQVRAAAGLGRAPLAKPARDDSQLASVEASREAEQPAPAAVGERPGDIGIFRPQSIEDASGRGLKAFFAALQRSAKNQGKARIAFYGDSHTAPDFMTARVRAGLSAAFGDGGPGFILPAKPWPHHRHALIEYRESRGFIAGRLTSTVHEGQFGLYGVALKTKGKRAALARFDITANKRPAGTDEIELYFLKQPGGGRVRVSIDGKRVASVSTASTGKAAAGYASFSAVGGAHQLEVKTLGDGPVTLFGLSVERGKSGVVLDTLGIPGARVRYHALWDQGLYREHLTRRPPDLFVLAYGTNECGDDDFSAADYEQMLRGVVTRLSRMLPEASCLLVGPTDRPERTPDGLYAPRVQEAAVIAVQRRVAARLGCGFFDTAQAMGGPTSIERFFRHDPPYAAPDRVHLTIRGYEAWGDTLLRSILRKYGATQKE